VVERAIPAVREAWRAVAAQCESGAVSAGVELCGTLTFIAVSRAAARCTRRSREAPDCGAHQSSESRKVATQYRKLEQDLRRLLANPPLSRRRKSSRLAAGFMKRAEFLLSRAQDRTENARATPYLNRFAPPAPQRVLSAMLLAAAPEFRPGLDAALDAYFTAVRALAKGIKASYPVAGMRASQLRYLVCDGRRPSTATELAQASALARSEAGSFWAYVGSALDNALAHLKVLWRQCDADCRQRLGCQPVL
jgi:hypothetical protein